MWKSKIDVAGGGNVASTRPQAGLSLPALAEGVGFEPTVATRTTTVFETVPIVHSGTPPMQLYYNTERETQQLCML
jgi:hypothetical protein